MADGGGGNEKLTKRPSVLAGYLAPPSDVAQYRQRASGAAHILGADACEAFGVPDVGLYRNATVGALAIEKRGHAG